MTDNLLLIRAEDFLWLGISWEAAHVVPSGSNLPARLVADAGAVLTIRFAPQAMLEVGAAGAPVPLPVSLSGSSQLCYKLAPGTEIELTPGGVLAAIKGATIVSSMPTEIWSALDLPSALLTTPIAQAGDGTTAWLPVISDLALAPVLSPEGVAGLWCAQLFAQSGQLRLHPLQPLDYLPLAGSPPLSAPDRVRILAESGQGGADATLTLSTLGATLTASLHTDQFGWEHQITLGRDQAVMVSSAGILYPFGHRAISIKASRRVIDLNGLASLQVVERIVVLEASRVTRRHDFRFSSVEILSREVQVLNHGRAYLRPLPNLLGPKQAELAQAQQTYSNAMAAAQATINNRPRTAEQLADVAGGAFGDDANNYIEARNRVAGGDQAIAELQADLKRQDKILQNMEKHMAALRKQSEMGEDVQADIDSLQGEMNEQSQVINQSVAGIANLTASIATARADLPGLQARVTNDLNSYPDTFEKLLAAADGDALAAQQAQADISRLQGEIAHLAQFQSEEVSFWPQANQRDILWQLRLSTASGELCIEMPLIFVHDLRQVGDPLYPDFFSLTDAATLEYLHKEWVTNKGGEVSVPGVAVDLVQDPEPQAGDVHEVQKLTILRDASTDGFFPKLSEIQIKLPSLRTLLPGHDEIITVSYAAVGEISDIPLIPVPRISIDFTGNADRSGGLVAPKFLADGLSRTLGPIAKGALAAVGVPDLASLYKDATLLGISLGSLIRVALDDLSQLQGAPQITPILDGEKPIGAQLLWNNVLLKSDGIFVASPTTKLDLAVQVTGEKTDTTCTVNEFSLALPPGSPVVQLSFASLAMTQSTNKAPDVQVKGFGFALLGELSLLEDLQEAVKPFLPADDLGIIVRQTPNGIVASYSFALPSVIAGVFQLRNIAVSVIVEVPFIAAPVSVSLGFASPENPFTVAILIFGGGGYFLIKTGPSGIDRLELSLDFGAFLTLDLVVASGEVHAIGALRLVTGAGGTTLQCSLRLGGSLEILGLVSVAIELVLMLTYESDGEGSRLVGRATLVIEIHVLFLSKSVELDSGEWVFSGSKKSVTPGIAHGIAPLTGGARGSTRSLNGTNDETAIRTEWSNYWKAFA
jgi:hypothetical protein